MIHSGGSVALSSDLIVEIPRNLMSFIPGDALLSVLIVLSLATLSNAAPFRSHFQASRPPVDVDVWVEDHGAKRDPAIPSVQKAHARLVSVRDEAVTGGTARKEEEREQLIALGQLVIFFLVCLVLAARDGFRMAKWSGKGIEVGARAQQCGNVKFFFGVSERM